MCSMKLLGSIVSRTYFIYTFLVCFLVSASLAETNPAYQTLRSEDPDAIALAVDRFRAKPDSEALPLLLSLLSHSDPLIRREGARGLGVIKRRDVQKGLKKMVRHDQDQLTRAEAALSLKEQGLSSPWSELEEEFLDRLVRPEEPFRFGIIRGLGRLGSKKAIAPLKKIVQEPNEGLSLRMEAALALGSLQEKGILARFLTLLRSKEESDRLVAVTGLGALEDRRAVPFLMKATADHAATIRQAAATALGKMGDPRAAPHLRRLLTSDDDPEVRRRSAVALGQLNDPDALSTIRDGLWSQGSLNDRAWAVRAWIAYKDPIVLPWLQEGVKAQGIPIGIRKKALSRIITFGGKTQRPFLLTLVERPGTAEALRVIAEEGLHQETFLILIPPPSGAQNPNLDFGSDTDIAILRGELANAPEEQRRLLVLRELVQRKDPVLKGALHILLESEDPLSRRVALWGFKLTGDADLGPTLLLGLSDPDGTVRSLAVRFLGEIDFPVGRGEILEKALDPDIRVRIELARVMAAQPISDEVMVLAQDPEPEVRTIILEGLIGRSDPILLPLFLSTSREDDPHLRALALVGLRHFDGAKLSWLFRERLSDSDDSVRRAAILGLERYLKGDDIEMFYPMLGDPSPMVQAEAAKAIGHSGMPRAIPVLQERLDRDPGLAYLREALAELKGRLLFPERYPHIGEGPSVPSGFLSPAMGYPLLLYRGPLLPLLQFDETADRWIPLDDEQTFWGLFKDPTAVPLRVEGEALLLTQEQGAERFVFPEKPRSFFLREETLWWGGKGVLGYFDPYSKDFSLFYLRAMDGADAISLFVEEDVVWIGLEREGGRFGLLRFDLLGRTETVYNIEDSGITDGAIVSVLPQGNQVWLAQRGRAIRLNLFTREGTVHRFLDRGGHFVSIRQGLEPMGPEGVNLREAWEEEMESPDPLRRVEAVWRLGLFSDAESVPVLLDRLEHASPLEREALSRALVHIGSFRSLETLIDRLMMAAPEDRPFYLEMVGEVGQSIACGGPCGKDVRNRRDGIFMQRREPRFPALRTVAHFLDDTEPEVVAAGIAALGKIGDRRALPLIVHFLGDPDTQFFKVAEESLTLFHQKYGPTVADSARIGVDLEGIFYRLRGEKADLARLQSDLNGSDYHRMLTALYRLGAPDLPLPPSLAQDLVGFLGLEDQDVRWGAILLFEKLEEDAISVLEPLLDNPREEVRRDATRALVRLKGGARIQVADMLIKRLNQEPASSLRKEILMALSTFSQEAGWRNKIQSLFLSVFRFDSQPKVRRQAMIHLVEAGMAPSWQDMLGMLRSRDNGLKSQILQQMIQEVDQARGLPLRTGLSRRLEHLLSEMLREENGSDTLKEWVIKLIQKARLRSLAEPLIEILPDQPLRLRIQIEEAIGMLNNKDGILVLAQRVQLGDARERYTSLLALKKLGYPFTIQEEEWLAIGIP